MYTFFKMTNRSNLISFVVNNSMQQQVLSAEHNLHNVDSGREESDYQSNVKVHTLPPHFLVGNWITNTCPVRFKLLLNITLFCLQVMTNQNLGSLTQIQII